MAEKYKTVYAYIFFGVATALVYLALSAEIISQKSGFICFNLLLMVYLAIEIRRLLCRQKILRWLNPALLASVATFALSFGISNLLFFLPEWLQEMVLPDTGITMYMNTIMLMVLAGAVAMWLGFWSRAAASIAEATWRSQFVLRNLRREFHLRPWFVAACLVISLASRLIMIRLGLFGYSSDINVLYALSAYREYLRIGELMGMLALMGAALRYYQREAERWSGWLLFGIFIYEEVFGLFSGFKSQVVIPILIVGFCAYYRRLRLPRWLIPSILISIIAAYLVIEPFRLQKNEDASFQNDSAIYIIDTLFSARIGEYKVQEQMPPIWLSVLYRMNLTYIASRGIEYAQEGPLPDDAPAFLKNIIIAPVHAVIPRLAWESKSMQNIGLWYNQDVLGYGSTSSSAMSPFTYLYFAGGIIAVLSGFFAVGIVQRVWLERFLPAGSGGIIIYLGMLGGLVTVDSAFNTFFSDIVRFFPLLFLGQFAMFRK